MSAPQTDIEKQRWRHRGPLLGMLLAVLFGLGAVFFWLTDEVSDANPPGTDEAPAGSVGAVDGGQAADPGTIAVPAEPAAPPTPAPVQ